MKPHMILTYDIDARAAYIYLRPGDMESNHARGYTENESDSGGGGTDILFDIRKDGIVDGVEILLPEAVFGRDYIKQLEAQLSRLGKDYHRFSLSSSDVAEMVDTIKEKNTIEEGYGDKDLARLLLLLETKS